MINAVIMAGSSGTRLWPLSRAAHPKKFLVLHGNETTLQATFKRLEGLDIPSSVTIAMRSTVSFWLSNFVKLISLFCVRKYSLEKV